jgi:hypothetical protein
MKKPPASSTGNALVPAMESLPAQQVNIDGEPWKELNEKFREDIDSARRRVSADRNFVRGGTLLCTAMVTPIAILTPPILLVLALPIGAMYALGASEQKKLNNLLAGETERAGKELREKFIEAQVEAYTAQKQMIIDAAEQHLSKGGLLGLEDAAWLGNLTPAILGEASDQLAITVMQIRQMLAHERCNKFKSDGGKTVATPVTFAEKRLSPDLQEHRFYLRYSLFENDAGIEEDSLPVIIQPEPAGSPQARAGNIKSFVDFINPFSGVALKRAYAKANMPQFKPVEIPGLAPVADFAQALESYESRNPPLDLPAVRGWKGGARKALPAPRSFK